MEEIKMLILWSIKGTKQIFKITRIIFIVLAVYIIAVSLFIFFSKKEQAKDFNNSQKLIQKNREKIYEFINNEKINSSKEGRTFIAIYRILNCTFVGEACTNNPINDDYYFKQSLFGKAANLLAFPFINPPASGIAWMAYKLTDIGLAPKSLAAPIGGIGLNAIYPLYPIWKVFRNISYLTTVLIMLTIGFLIMLRTKINPQTVIGIENSLPKIIISLILIALSFPLAGFLIDFMYILILLIIFFISPDSGINIANKYLTGGFFSIFSSSFFSLAKNIGFNIVNILPSNINQFVKILAAIPLGIVITNKAALHKAIGKATSGGEVSLVGVLAIKIPGLEGFLEKIVWLINFITNLMIIYRIPIISIFLTLAVFFSLLFTTIKLIFLLIFTYIRIILFIIFSPLYMLLEAIPGKSGFSDWMKGIFIELLTFPLVVVFLLIPYIIMNIKIGSPQSIWTPPFLSGLNNEAIIYLVAGGIFLMSPDLIRQIKKSLGAQRPLIGLNFRTFLFGGGMLAGGIIGPISAARSWSELLPATWRNTIRKALPKYLGDVLLPKSFLEMYQGNPQEGEQK